MTHQLSFGYIKIIADDIAEVIVNNGIEMTLEMLDEYDNFLNEHFKNNTFGLLINKINHYTYTYEAQLAIGSLENIGAIAVINYHPRSVKTTQSLLNKRQMEMILSRHAKHAKYLANSGNNRRTLF